MEYRKGSIIVTKNGEYVLKRMMSLYNPFNLQEKTSFVVDDNGEEKFVREEDIITVKNNHIKNIEEP